MISVRIFDNIAKEGLQLFNPDEYEVNTDASDPEIILVRSHSLHHFQFTPRLRAIGRAGVGTDNIPVDKLTSLGIPVFNSPGANANAVKELVLAAMLIGYRHLDEASSLIEDLSKNNDPIDNQQIEQHKKKYVGHEILGKTLAVIGLGHVGVKVANAALSLGMRVIAYDPDMTISNALALMPGVEKSNDLNASLTHADIITLHVPLNAKTKHLIHEKNILLLKKDALLLNFSREEIVKEEAVLNQLNQNQLMSYITDFPTHNLAQHPRVLCFPHLGASTFEAEQNSAKMVIRNLCNYMKYGTIDYSVNFPNISLPPILLPDCYRLLIINQNVPGALGQITQVLSKLNYNIEQMVNTSQEDIAVNLIDVSSSHLPPKDLHACFQQMPSVIKAHLLDLQQIPKQSS